jgi:hypothetical protein
MATSVTLEVLRQHLEEFGWKQYDVTDEEGEQEGLIFTGYMGSDGKPHRIIIDPVVEKGALRIMAPDIVMAPADKLEPERLHELTFAVAAINARSVLAWLSYAPDVGAVAAQVAMPIDENDLSFEQFKRALEAVLWMISTYGPGLQEVADGKRKALEIIEEPTKLPTPEELEAMRQVLADLEDRVRKAQEADKPEGDKE